ncbi:MAG TPA: cyclopropane-fatty-acyl-phospholipid synthase family protein [Opitutaceae bacterium]
MAPPHDSSLRFLSELFRRNPPPNVAVRLWDGAAWPDERPRAATLVLKHPGALHAMFHDGTEMGLAEAYLDGDFDVEGNMESAFEVADLLADGVGWGRSISLAMMLRGLPERPKGRREFKAHGRKHSGGRDRRAIAFHYDLSNDFYRLWLDPQMVYSCAYFESPDADIGDAQAAKLDYICRKLRLQPGQRLLDIGCGWGALAIHAAQHHGAEVVGVTLSENQAAFANSRIESEGLGQRVRIELRDYRDLDSDGGFDAAVSVGMAEHVGAENLPSYFRTVLDLLRPGGIFLNHAIGEGSRFRPTKGPSFIDEYVFPDSDIPPIRTTVTAAETSGFEVRDAENLREHYALTLRSWVRRLEAHHEQALSFVDEATFRIWRLYMAGSAYGFTHGKLAIYQTLLAKPDAAGDAHLPLARSDWYADARHAHLVGS